MLTQRGSNVHVVGINGNFDDAQSAVKRIFSDVKMKERMKLGGKRFSSANSINIGRLVPQIVYYFYAYGQMVKSGEIGAGDPINIAVPTGNFGNILAAWYAKQMGLPCAKLICASNENRVLVDFFHTGTYDRRREFILTSSPSMDILISSNLERLVYEAAGEDADRTRLFMESLSSVGIYEISDAMRERLQDFYGDYTTQDGTKEQIRRVYEECGYVMDTHTAVASDVYRRYRGNTGDMTKTVIASTASPYKFARTVVSSVRPELSDAGDQELFDALRELSGVDIPPAVRDILTAPILHNTVVDVRDMADEVLRWLEI